MTKTEGSCASLAKAAADHGRQKARPKGKESSTARAITAGKLDTEAAIVGLRAKVKENRKARAASSATRVDTLTEEERGKDTEEKEKA